MVQLARHYSQSINTVWLSCQFVDKKNTRYFFSLCPVPCVLFPSIPAYHRQDENGPNRQPIINKQGNARSFFFFESRYAADTPGVTADKENELGLADYDRGLNGPDPVGEQTV